MQDRFTTIEDAEARFEKLVSETKRLHSPLIFKMKLENYELIGIRFDTSHVVTLKFSNGIEKEDKTFELHHKQPLFAINFCVASYEDHEFDLSEEYQKEVIKDIASTKIIKSLFKPDDDKTAEEEYKDRVKKHAEFTIRHKELDEERGEYDLEDEEYLKQEQEAFEKEPYHVLTPMLN